MSDNNLSPNNKLVSRYTVRNYTFVVYILYAIGMITSTSIFFGRVTALPGIIAIILGVILAYVKRQEALDTVYYHHLQYLLRTFWISLSIVLLIIATTFILFILYDYLPAAKSIISKISTVYILVMNTTLILLFIWYLYRIIFGFTRMLEGRSIDKNTVKINQ